MTAARRRNAPVLIAGGGIGGLSAAVALARKGISSHVLEAEPRFGENGAGIQIGPNGAHILRMWGLDDALEREAAHPGALAIGDGLTGRRLARIPLGDAALARYGAPYFVAERAALHRLLRDKASEQDGVVLTCGFRLYSFRCTPGGIAAMSADGREIEGCALIGADGVHSRTRTLLHGRRPRMTGRIAWRATASADGRGVTPDGDDVQLWLGPGVHFVRYPCGPEGPLNAVAVTRGTADRESWGSRGDPLTLKSEFADWADAPYSLLQDFDNWMCWPLLDMPPLPEWGQGRITLLGDAAHPVMPFLASGAVMAIEDAAVLASEMAREPEDPALALRAYEAGRRSRVEKLRAAATRMGAIYHMSGPMRLARNLVLAAMPPSRLLARNDWLYGYRAAF